MTCETIRERLNEYLDGDVGEAERQTIAAHLDSCAACSEEVQALRDLLARAAGLPRDVVPGRDLWPAIAAELRREPVVRLRPRRRLAPLGGLAAAAALVAVVSGLGLFTKGGPPAGQPSTRTGPEADLLEPERDYAQATKELSAALDAKRDAVAPETRESLDKDLKVIDQALVDVREALRQDPQNEGLNRLLATTHRLKVEALRRVLRLASI